MTRRTAEALAQWGLTSFLTLGALFVGPLLDGSSIWERLGAAVVGIPSTTLVFSWIRKELHAKRLRQIVGEWFYFTHPHGKARDLATHSFGRMKFFVDSFGELRYRVNIFPDLHSLLESSSSPDAKASTIGMARSAAVRYDEQRAELWIIYVAEYHDPATRRRVGHLYLDTSQPGVLTGTWASDIDREQLSAGVMRASRSQDFEQMYKKHTASIDG